MITIIETLYKKMPDDIKVCFKQLPNPSSEEVRECFPDNRPGFSGGGGPTRFANASGGKKLETYNYHQDSGNASRFFKSIIYYPKASKSERNAGCEGLEAKFTKTMNDGIGMREHNENEPTAYNKNNHPTVKPIALMEYLINMVSREGQTILDPFAGSGTTGVAAKKLKRNYILIEKEEEYIPIIKARLNSLPKTLF